MIPKIIHQIGPKDKSDWNPVWNLCYESWKKCFPDFQHIFWNDSDDIDNFIKEKYPSKFEYYQNLPFHIMKLDFARYAILNYYGGIYADLDVYCYENFYNDLIGKICFIEPINFPDNDEGELIMGCLIASEPKQFFWDICLIDSEKKSKKVSIDSGNVFNNFQQVLDITGSKLLLNLSNTFFEQSNIQYLPKSHYHPSLLDYSDGMKTKHMKTLTWGKETIAVLKETFNNMQLDYETGMKKMFSDVRGISIDEYNFNQNYN